MDLRIGVIGTGAIGQEHIQRLNHKTQGRMLLPSQILIKKKQRYLLRKLVQNFMKQGKP